MMEVARYALAMSTCTFCRILAHELAASRVYEDERALAFLDVAPFSRGHTLVVPPLKTVAAENTPATSPPRSATA